MKKKLNLLIIISFIIFIGFFKLIPLQNQVALATQYQNDDIYSIINIQRLKIPNNSNLNIERKLNTTIDSLKGLGVVTYGYIVNTTIFYQNDHSNYTGKGIIFFDNLSHIPKIKVTELRYEPKNNIHLKINNAEIENYTIETSNNIPNDLFDFYISMPKETKFNYSQIYIGINIIPSHKTLSNNITEKKLDQINSQFTNIINSNWKTYDLKTTNLVKMNIEVFNEIATSSISQIILTIFVYFGLIFLIFVIFQISAKNDLQLLFSLMIRGINKDKLNNYYPLLFSLYQSFLSLIVYLLAYVLLLKYSLEIQIIEILFGIIFGLSYFSSKTVLDKDQNINHRDDLEIPNEASLIEYILLVLVGMSILYNFYINLSILKGQILILIILLIFFSISLLFGFFIYKLQIITTNYFVNKESSFFSNIIYFWKIFKKNKIVNKKLSIALIISILICSSQIYFVLNSSNLISKESYNRPYGNLWGNYNNGTEFKSKISSLNYSVSILIPAKLTRIGEDFYGYIINKFNFIKTSNYISKIFGTNKKTSSLYLSENYKNNLYLNVKNAYNFFETSFLNFSNKLTIDGFFKNDLKLPGNPSFIYLTNLNFTTLDEINFIVSRISPNQTFLIRDKLTGSMSNPIDWISVPKISYSMFFEKENLNNLLIGNQQQTCSFFVLLFFIIGFLDYKIIENHEFFLIKIRGLNQKNTVKIYSYNLLSIPLLVIFVSIFLLTFDLIFNWFNIIYFYEGISNYKNLIITDLILLVSYNLGSFFHLINAEIKYSKLREKF